MSTPYPSIAGPVHSPDEILAHPRFAAARAAFVEAVLAAHEGDHFRSRLLLEAMRQITFNVIVSLHLAMTRPTGRPGRPRGGSRTNWRRSGSRARAGSTPWCPGSIQLGYVQSHPAEQDGRMRLLTPTAKMMALDREWLALAAVSRTADAQEGESEWSWRVRWPPSPAS
jgi:hypothetical protein